MAEFFAACHNFIRNDPIYHALHAGESQSPPAAQLATRSSRKIPFDSSPLQHQSIRIR